MTQRCGTLLYLTNFSPIYDFTVSFKYNFNTGGAGSTQNNGFGIFFVTSNIFFNEGGGPGNGLGMVDTTNLTSLSSIVGVYLTIGFDRIGNYCVQGAPPYFPTGLASQIPNSITIRKNYSDFDFLSCIAPSVDSIFLEDTDTIIRIGMRKMFQTANIDVLSGDRYINIATFDTQILPDTLPGGLKFGISYSGDTEFTIQDINVNCTST
jgi:hypothetical protein